MSTHESVVGVLIIDKPAGMTSHDVVAHVRKIIREYNRQVGLPAEASAKVGHTGTLDPFATGVLLVAVGPATRLIEYTHDLLKTYEATLFLGATSDTDDVTGEIFNSQFSISNQFSMPQIKKTLQQFVGTISQVPPAYAAIKIKGKKLYEYARRGESVERKARMVTIHQLELLDYHYPHLTIRVVCSTGTYIRALGRDVGESLGTGAYLTALRRTAIGPFELSTASPLEVISSENWQKHLLPPQQLVAHLPSITLSEENVVQLRQGKAVLVSQTMPGNQLLVLLNTRHDVIGIGHYDKTSQQLLPRKIL